MIQETLELGPIHEWLPGPMKLRLGMSGDRIVKVETQFGFASRLIEKTVEGLPIRDAQLRVSRLEPESALLLDRLFSEAVEEITKTEVSDRIEWIRDITSDLSEINFQLKYLAKMAHRMGIQILFHAVLKHRESLLDLLELLTGSRYGYYYLVPGGARYDLTEGFQERLETWVKTFQNDYARLEALFCWTHTFQNRMRTLGQIVDLGECGFVSEASIETTRYGRVSHVESRLVYSLKHCLKMSQSIEAHLVERKSSVHLQALGQGRGGDANLELETARGVWKMKLSLDQDLKVKSLVTHSPSELIQNAIAPALEGESLEDVSIILESLSLSIPELDR